MLDKLDLYIEEIKHNEKIMEDDVVYTDKELVEIISNPAKLAKIKKVKRYKEILERLEEGGMI